MEAAARKLADRSMTRTELAEWLKKKAYEEEEIDRVLLEFTELGYLNDARYCEEYFHYALSRNRAGRRVFAELKQKGIPAETIENAYEDFLYENPEYGDETARARAEMEKVLRLADLTPEDPIPEKIIGRVARRLTGCGFETSVIHRVLGELKRERTWTGQC